MCEGTDVTKQEVHVEWFSWSVQLRAESTEDEAGWEGDRVARMFLLNHTMDLGFSPEAEGETLQGLIGKGHRQISFEKDHAGHLCGIP